MTDSNTDNDEDSLNALLERAEQEGQRLQEEKDPDSMGPLAKAIRDRLDDIDDGELHTRIATADGPMAAILRTVTEDEEHAIRGRELADSWRRELGWREQGTEDFEQGDETRSDLVRLSLYVALTQTREGRDLLEAFEEATNTLERGRLF